MKTERKLSRKVIELMGKGVKIPNPFSVDIAEEINLDRISSDGVILYPGTRIYGAKTLICRGAKLGYEAPVTIVDCRIGPFVELKGGFFTSSVFLEKANMASGAQVREGCILEEEANASHTVGIKQTILFPFVTLGSLINFCDCFMAGGTSRKNHSEVGSSYIHFNYTPNQDKATASLIGDVPKGVMINQAPIFLGGQGGLIGPSRIGYGTVIAAGTVYRQDFPEGGKLIRQGDTSLRETEFIAGYYGSLKRRLSNNVYYITNLLALKEWYAHVRQPFFQLHDMGQELYEGLQDTLDIAIKERLKRLKDLSEKMKVSVEIAQRIHEKNTMQETLLRQKSEFCKNWGKIEEVFTGRHEQSVDTKNRDTFVTIIHDKINEEDNYIKVIQGLDKDTSTLGTSWLQNIVNHITNTIFNLVPSCDS
ncbi:MAG TPA: UDP-N-acetylglucosamine pyrophosphorylase [Syntrophaceae bacterium]|jgi:UDP-N-acetylglucosamine/UDP-N-acetylgalactosamine diphosphorylase|nr:UDP-N-acetylglucosamine pyrophosphorylase [Syntrophaceae bacterium]